MTRYLLLFWQLRYCFCAAPSLTRGMGLLLYMLLALASAVFLGAESLGTLDHILLSQIWLPFSSPLTTHRVTVEVFNPASTLVKQFSQSQSYIATDGQSVCLSWCRAPPGAHDQMLHCKHMTTLYGLNRKHRFQLYSFCCMFTDPIAYKRVAVA
jgi:hypothetical protein